MNDASVRQNESLESLVALVVDDFRDAQKGGAEPDIEEYAARYPHAADLLRKVLASWRLIGLSAGGGTAGVAGEEVSGVLGDFRLLREVGRGGMGIIYEAEQISLNRRVALKVLPFAATMDARQLQRFRNEAQAAAGLHHTNIVPVFFVGCERHVHFYAMQFIDGRDLASVVAQLREEACRQESKVKSTGAVEPDTRPIAGLVTEHWSRSLEYFRSVARLGIQAAEALDYAHQMGVVHRDVKPANLLVDATGRLWVTDFGLAQLRTDAGLTMTGDLLGTLRYMSPEQAQARRVLIDHHTDIYSLGATLYEMITLRPVFLGNDRQELLRQIAFDEPKAPRRVDKAIPAELEIIVLKALDKNPADRYATAQELADDLRRFLNHETIRARRPSLVQRARKWTRRHRGVTVAALAALLVLTLVSTASAVMIWGQKQEIWEKQQRTDEALHDRAEALRDRTRALYLSNVRLAELETRAGNLSRAEQFLDECDPELRQWEWHYLKRLCHPTKITLKHTSPVSGVCFRTADGRLLASANGLLVRVWEASTGRELHSLRTAGGQATELAFSSDLARIARAGRDNSSVWDLSTGRKLMGVAGGPSMALSSDGKLLAEAVRPRANQKDWTVQVWDAESGQERFTFHGGTGGWITSMAFSPDRRRLAVAFQELNNTYLAGGLSLMDVPTSREVFTKAAHGAAVRSLDFSPDGALLATASADWTLKLWDVATGKEMRTLRGHTGPVYQCCFSPDGRRLTSSGAGSVCEWEVATGKAIATIPVAEGRVALDPVGRLLAITRGEEVVVRSAARFEGALNIRGVTLPASAAFSPDGKRVAVSGAKIHVCDAATGDEKMCLNHSDQALVQCVEYSPDGMRLASGSHDRTAKIWDAQSGKVVLTLTGHAKAVYAVAFAPDGKRLATASQDGTVKIWDLTTGRATLTLQHASNVCAVAFSPDGQRLVSATGGAEVNGDQIKVWDLKAAQEVCTVNTPITGLRSVEFSRDGKRIVAPAGNGDVKVWDAATGMELLCVNCPGISAVCAKFSPDGHRLVTPALGGRLLIWDAATGKEILTLHGHRSWVSGLAFSPDGRRLASMSMLGKYVKVWDATPVE